MAGPHLGIADGFRLAEPVRGAILDLAASAWDLQSDGMIAACLMAAQLVEHRSSNSPPAVLAHYVLC
jgi:hypothetical protein